MRSVIAAVVAFLLTCLVLVAVPVIALGSQSPTGGICGPGGTGQSVANVTLDAEQLANAATIAAVTQSRPLTDVAADVQKPLEAYRGLYARWQPLAAQLTAQLWTGRPNAGAPGQGAGATTNAAPCAASVGRNPAATLTPGPNGLTLTSSPADNAAATFAIAQLGKPYLWGAQGPTAFDCSGLTMAAWASVGVTIPRVTYTQATAGTPVSVQDARTGDLVLIPGSEGTPANPGHVAMVAGLDTGGALWLVDAARTGVPVRLSPMAGWANQIVTIRRIG